MSYQALYRTWRPQNFDALIGQPHVRQTLTNAILKQQIAHAYLFCGPRGTGKTSAAKLFAKAVNCLHPDGAEPCNVCDVCVSITKGTNVDVEEIDAASNRGVDEIRELRDKVNYAPTMATRKVYIVDEVHMLTPEAFNALLKTLEEPPPHVLFMLATTEPHRIPGTIVSRCQRFDFHRISEEMIVQRLEAVVEHEAWKADSKALWKIAEAADGGLRDALGLLEQASAFGNGKIDELQVSAVIGGVSTDELLAIVRSLCSQNYLEVVDHLSKWYSSGKDATRVTYDLLQVVRDLFIVKLSSSEDALSGKPVAPYRAVLSEVDCSSEWLLTATQKLGELYTQLRFVEQPRLALEAVLFGLVAQTGTHGKVAATQDAAPPANVASKPISASTPAAATEPASASESAQPPEPQAQQSATTKTAPEQRKRSVAGPRAGQDRKRETLLKLYRDRNEEFEEIVRSRWGDVLHKVKSDRVQTHAWLEHGELVMATNDAVVLSFSSRIHREAVMKAADRQVIETALVAMLDSDVQMFAVLKADWDAFVSSLHSETSQHEVKQDANETSEELSPVDEIVQRAKSLFGEDKVMVEDKE